MTPRQRFIAVAFAGVLLVCLAIGLTLVLQDPILYVASRYLTTEDEVRPSDLLFVPSGNPRVRFQKAIDLMRAGVADRILVNLEAQSKTDKEWEKRYGERLSTYQVIAHMMAVDRIPTERVSISDRRAVSTQDDFAILKDWLGDGKINSVVVVTSGTHLRRCRLVARRTIGDKAQFYFVAADRPDPDQYISRGKRALDLFVAYMKLGYYYFFVF